MSLNIKNEGVHDLVREAAKLTGKSQTSVVEEALRQYLDALARDDAHTKAERILTRLRENLATAGARADVDDLYDAATGMPK
jgi:antitoxin VapB